MYAFLSGIYKVASDLWDFIERLFIIVRNLRKIGSYFKEWRERRQEKKRWMDAQGLKRGNFIKGSSILENSEVEALYNLLEKGKAVIWGDFNLQEEIYAKRLLYPERLLSPRTKEIPEGPEIFKEIYTEFRKIIERKNLEIDCFSYISKSDSKWKTSNNLFAKTMAEVFRRTKRLNKCVCSVVDKDGKVYIPDRITIKPNTNIAVAESLLVTPTMLKKHIRAILEKQSAARIVAIIILFDAYGEKKELSEVAEISEDQILSGINIDLRFCKHPTLKPRSISYFEY